MLLTLNQRFEGLDPDSGPSRLIKTKVFVKHEKKLAAITTANHDPCTPPPPSSPPPPPGEHVLRDAKPTAVAKHIAPFSLESLISRRFSPASRLEVVW